MIGKAKSNKSLVATINYNLKEGAELIFTNQLNGEDIKDYQLEMQLLQKCYSGKARQLTLHVILSPHITEGKNLSQEQWQRIANKYLNEMDLKEHQAIGFLHCDKEHRHLHLVINKVRDSKLKLYHDGFIGKRTQKAADCIAIEMNLIRAMEIRNQNIQNKKKQKNSTELIIPFLNPNQHEILQPPLGSKQLFKQQLKEILAKTNVKSIEGYFDEVQKAGFKVLLYHNKETKELRGYGIEKNNTKMDASTIGKQFTITNLEMLFEIKKQQKLKEKILEDMEEKLETYSVKRGMRM
ncbi:MAG: hypothetical protein BGN92_08570 [Sphingobacteriales bacterium 41-5]|nr:MAG: hypothetical protein BGN92_08570 [Sphingobacteriales bacterium 41-5]